MHFVLYNCEQPLSCSCHKKTKTKKKPKRKNKNRKIILSINSAAGGAEWAS